MPVDLGSLGMRSDYEGDQLAIPTQKPHKRPQNPNLQLSAEPKAANTALRRIRLFIAQAIGGMKRCTILVHAFRNREASFEDDVMGGWAGLWHLVLSY